MSGHGAEVEVPHDEHDPFVKKVGLSVAIFAVILAVAGAGGKNAGKDMMSAQIDASDTFAWYQAKANRDVLYTQEKESLEQVAEPTEKQKQRLAHVTKKLTEYEKEKKELLDEGTALKKERKTAHRMDGYFDYAELLLQLAIVLASISMLSKARWPWAVSLLLAAVGLAITAGGFVIPKHAPTVHLPFIDPAHPEGEAKH